MAGEWEHLQVIIRSNVTTILKIDFKDL